MPETRRRLPDQRFEAMELRRRFDRLEEKIDLLLRSRSRARKRT
jgi:hypothetical protein